jgi:septal ring factor EnvC (AmiA/AmiB activator)
VLDRALGDEAVGVTRLGEHGAGALRVHEGHAQKQYKLRQVVEVVFDVHDDRLAQLLEQLKRLRDERREYEREGAALETFLREEEVPAPETLAERRAEIAAGRSEVQARLTAVTAEAMSSTDFAEDLRTRYGRARTSPASRSWFARDGRATARGVDARYRGQTAARPARRRHSSVGLRHPRKVPNARATGRNRRHRVGAAQVGPR